MIRAAAKNHRDVVIVVDSEDYPAVLDYLKEGKTTNFSAENLCGRPFNTLLLMILQSQNGYGNKLKEVSLFLL